MLGLVFLIAAGVAALFGFQYFGVAARTNSAIHEIAGVLGLGLGAMLLGLAVVLWTLSGLRDRLGKIEGRLSASEAGDYVTRVIDRYAGPAYALWSLAEAAGNGAGHRAIDPILEFVRKSDGFAKLGKEEAAGITEWVKTFGWSDAQLGEARRAVEGLSLASRDHFATAARDILTGTKANLTPDQRKAAEYFGVADGVV